MVVLASFKTITEKSADRIQAYASAYLTNYQSNFFHDESKSQNKSFQGEKGRKTFKSRSIKKKTEMIIYISGS